MKFSGHSAELKWQNSPGQASSVSPTSSHIHSNLAWCHFESAPLQSHCQISYARHWPCFQKCVRSSCVTRSHAEHSIPTRLKKRCPEVGCPFPTGSPFQWLEIPLCTKRPDMIPQHCRQGRELGTVLIRWALLSGKILKGMQPIVVNCMGPHSIPSAAGMCYLSWIGETSIPAVGQCLCWIVDCSLIRSARIASIIWSSHGTSSRCSASDDWTLCVHSHTAHFNFTCRLLCVHTPLPAFEVSISIPVHSHCIVPWAVMTVYSVLISVMAFSFYWLINVKKKKTFCSRCRQWENESGGWRLTKGARAVQLVL